MIVLQEKLTSWWIYCWEFLLSPPHFCYKMNFCLRGLNIDPDISRGPTPILLKFLPVIKIPLKIMQHNFGDGAIPHYGDINLQRYTAKRILPKKLKMLTQISQGGQNISGWQLDQQWRYLWRIHGMNLVMVTSSSDFWWFIFCFMHMACIFALVLHT